MRFVIPMLLLAHPALAGADAAPPCGLHAYRAVVVRVIDGDTVVADIDLGFNIWLRGEHLRLYGVQAPERGAKGARRAAAALRASVEGRTIHICTHKMKRLDREARGSFGRYLVSIYRDGENVNDWLIDEEFAQPFEPSAPRR